MYNGLYKHRTAPPGPFAAALLSAAGQGSFRGLAVQNLCYHTNDKKSIGLLLFFDKKRNPGGFLFSGNIGTRTQDLSDVNRTL